jgi:hypothetical protein
MTIAKRWHMDGTHGRCRMVNCANLVGATFHQSIEAAAWAPQQHTSTEACNARVLRSEPRSR